MEEELEIIDEQIKELKEKGLKIKDEIIAKRTLLKENYYFITQGYEDVFLDLKKSTSEQEMYVPDTYFEELFAIYKLDRELRNLIFDYINLIETHVKSNIAYIFSQKYGDDNFLIRENFINGDKYDTRIERLFETIESNKQRNFKNIKSDVRDYYNEHKILPLWVLVKVFTFGTTSHFYDLMKIEEKQKVAQYFNLNYYDMSQYLKTLNIVRNICAHGDMLFNVRINRKLNINSGISNLFSVMIILKKILDKNEFCKMFNKVESILDEVRNDLDEISFKKLLEIMGFSENYKLLDEIV